MSAREVTDFDVKIGARLRTLRNAADVSQESLAAALGVTFQQVQKYEKGANRMSAERLHDVAHALGVSVATLFGEEAAPGGELISRVANALAIMPKAAADNWVSSLEAVAHGTSGKRRK